VKIKLTSPCARKIEIPPSAFVADILAVLIARAKEDGQIEGLYPLDTWVSQSMEHDLEKAMNMKLILYIFE
jgi:hypothetical protein